MNSFLSVLERDILQHLSNAVVGLITADQCLIFNGQPSAASLRRKLLTQAGLQASCFHIPTWLWEKGGKEANICSSLLLGFHCFRNAPRVPFFWASPGNRHFTLSPSLQREPKRLSETSGEDEPRPTWLTYQWRVRHIPSTHGVTHKWSWQHAKPPPPRSPQA